jgi:hypothetical protein
VVAPVNHHLMSPTAVAILLLLALVIDWMSFGPNSIRDRIAFCLALPAISEGFNGGPFDRFTVEALGSAIDRLKAAGGDSYVAGANTERVIAALVGILFIYTIGVLMPEKWSNKLGPYARLAFSKSGGAMAVAGPVGTGAKRRLNWRLWICAALLGVLNELPHGLVGELLHTFVSVLDSVAAPMPVFLFGGA